MRDEPRRSSSSALTWLIVVLAAGFVVENIFLHWFSQPVGDRFLDLSTLSIDGLKQGHVWTLFTHGLIQNPDNVLGLGLLLLMLYVFGRGVLSEIGGKGLITVIVVAVIAGGAAWLGVHWSQAARIHYGAGAGVSALVVLLAFLSPKERLSLWGILPVRINHLALAFLVVHLAGLVALELPGRATGSWYSLPHSAHLGGMLAGWLYFRYRSYRQWWKNDRHARVELPEWVRKTRKAKVAAPAFKVNFSNSEDLRAEVDRILDKINSEGFGALTADEKRRLNSARDQLSRQ